MQDNAIQILLVEDDPDDERLVRALLREALFPTPLQIHHVDQLGGALQRLQLGGIDLILLGLPRSNVADLEIVARTLEASSGLPLVVLVAEDAPTRTVLCAGAGHVEAAHITLTQGTWIGLDGDAPERLQAQLQHVIDRAGEVVPQSGAAQGSHEISQAAQHLT